MTHVYVVEGWWDWEGSQVLAIAATLSGAKRFVREDNKGATVTITRSEHDKSVWNAYDIKSYDGISITKTKILA